MDTPSWERMLAQAFPRLSREGYEIINEPTKTYNCIAYAAKDTSKWWSTIETRYWPNYATRSENIDSLIEVFTGLGFQRCRDSSLESGCEKVVLYEEQGAWKHAARQTPSGRWRSKMGEGPLIEHLSPQSLAGGVYGEPTIYMRRLTASAATSA